MSTAPPESSLRESALEIYRSGLRKITPEYLLRQALRVENNPLELEGDDLRLTFLEREERVALSPGGRILLLAVGKAAAPMALEAHAILGNRIGRGLVVTKEGFSLAGLPWPVRETGHPVPDEKGVAAAAEAEALLRDATRDDLALVLVSGGASALLPAPIAGISLPDKQALVERMLRANMDIHEINTVRKAVSRFKGGGLAALAAPARTVGLYLSDVPGDRLSSIGSGPTVPEPVRFEEVVTLLREKGLWDETPAAVQAALREGREPGKTPPEPPAMPPLNGLIGANRHLLRAMGEAAEGLGFRAGIIEEPTTGLNHDALPGLLERWEAFRREQRGSSGSKAGAEKPLAFISGGETTVEVTGSGKGGRCQELAALMLPRMEEGTVFLAAGSDGNDGPTDAAGGVVDRGSWLDIQARNLPYGNLLADNDSYRLLELSGNLIKVPPTRNNVMDVHLFLGLP